MPTINLGFESISYIERGSSSVPMVFIHGAGSSHLIWGAQVRAFGDVARAIALDLPGHSKSHGLASKTPPMQAEGSAGAVPLPAAYDSITAYGVVVRDFLDALEIQQAILIGHSMGGAIAQTLALDHPERVAALALVATGARLRVSPAFIDGFRADFDATVDQIIAHYFAPDADPRMLQKSAALLRACGQSIVLGDFSACNGFDATERLSEIRAPTLVLSGRADALTPVKYSEFLASRIPQAELKIIDGAGHHVMLEKAEEFNRVLREWLQRTFT